MDKQLFDDAIGEVPPSTINVDAAIVRGRRAARLRMVANPVAAVGLVVVLGVGAVAYTLTSGDNSSGGMRVGGQSTSPSTSSSAPSTPPTSHEKLGGLQPPEQCSRSNLETGPQVIARIDPTAKTAIQQQRPDLQFAAFNFNQTNGDGSTPTTICGNDTYFMATATTTGPEGTGNITISMQADYFGPTSCADQGTAENQCEDLTGPNGESVLKTSDTGENGVVTTQIIMKRKDGTQVLVSAVNVATSARDGGAPTATSVPLTVDQMIAIAAVPGMTLFP